MKFRKLTLLLVLMLFVVACGGGDSAETPVEPDAAVAESDTAEPTNTPEPAPTNTPLPEPTNTPEPEPTSTPLPEPTNTPEPEPEPTEEPAASAAKLLGSDSLRFDDEVLGLSFSYPADWFAETIFGTIIFVTDVDINDESVDSDSTSGLIVIVTPPEEDMTPEDMIESAFGEIDLDDDEFTILDGPTDTEVDGQAGITVSFEAPDGEDMIRGRATAVPTDDAVFVFMTVMSQMAASDETEEILNAIVQTAELGTPDFELALDEIGFDFDEPDLADLIYAVGEFGTVIQIDSAETSVFTYTLAADTNYFFLTQPSSDTDPVLKLLDANRELIDEVDDNGGSGAEFMSVEVAADGDYQLVVEEFFGGQLVASLIAVSGESAQSAELSAAAPELELVVAASDAPQIVIAMPDDSLDLVISDGFGLYVDAAGIDDPELVYLEAGSDYTLLISDFSTAPGAFSYVVIEVDESFAPTSDNDVFSAQETDFSAALPMALDTPQIAQSDSGIVYQVSLEGGVNYVLLAEPSDLEDVVLGLYGADTILIDEADSGFDGEHEVILFSPSASGDYFVEVAGFFGAVDAQVAVLTAQGDVVSAEFDGTAGQEIAVTVPANAKQLLFVAQPSDDLDIVLTDPIGDVIDENASGTQESVLLPASPDVEQTVVMSLFNDDAGTVNYISVELPDSFTLSQ